MYVIVGGSSFLGSYVIKNICDSSCEQIVASYHSALRPEFKNTNLIWQNLDINDTSSIRKFVDIISENRRAHDVIKCVYLIGYIRPDDCLKNPALAVDVNIRGLANFLHFSRENIDSLIFTSTDFVVGESLNNYRYKETDSPSPINLFGVIKRACESIILSHGYNIVRLPFMFGESLIPGRTHFIEHIRSSIQNNEPFEVLADYYENSLDYNTTASCIYGLLAKYGSHIPHPIIHICADKPISKYEIALQYAQKNHLSHESLRPLALRDAQFFLARRCTVLMDNSLLKNLLNKKEIKIHL